MRDIKEVIEGYKEKLVAYLRFLKEMDEKYGLGGKEGVGKYYDKLTNSEWDRLSRKMRELTAIQGVLHFTEGELKELYTEASRIVYKL